MDLVTLKSIINVLINVGIKNDKVGIMKYAQFAWRFLSRIVFIGLKTNNVAILMKNVFGFCKKKLYNFKNHAKLL